MEALKTPLYDAHIASGGRMVAYNGWMLPVQYSGILQEYAAVRERAGLFDVSHMGRFDLTGALSTEWLERTLTNTVKDAAVGRAVYSPVCYASGGTVDDVIAYREGEEHWTLVVNAGNREKDFVFFKDTLSPGTKLVDLTGSTVQLALQGPLALSMAERFFGVPVRKIKRYGFTNLEFHGETVKLSRTGYTGEDGLEIYLPASLAAVVWNGLLSGYAEEGLLPCGLGSRDLLRFEACMPLYGHEISADITPLEAGLGRFVDLEKPDFVGKAALIAPPRRRRIGLRMTDRGIAREGYPVYCENELAGHVTSGSLSPCAKGNLAMALVDVRFADCVDFEVDIRGKRAAAVGESMPFYTRAK